MNLLNKEHFISYNLLATNGERISTNRFVPFRVDIDTQESKYALPSSEANKEYT
jgi:hypothetical protein